MAKRKPVLKDGTAMDHIEKIAHYRFFKELTHEEIGKIVGYSAQTIKKVLDVAVKRDLIPEYAKGRELTFNSSKEERVKKMEMAHCAMLDKMNDEKLIAEASFADIVRGAKATHEMLRLENNQSTSNTGISGVLKLVDAVNVEGEL